MYLSLLLFILISGNVSQFNASTECVVPSPFDPALIQQASTQDLQLMLNLLYWSYRRSVITLATQESAASSLLHHWQAWHCCAERRLDPTAQSPCCSLPTGCTDFFSLTHEYHSTQSFYSALVSQATQPTSYQYAPCATQIKKMRQEVRTAVLNALKPFLASLKREIATIFASLRSGALTTNRTVHAEQHDTCCLKQRRGLFNNLLQGFALSSFSESDAQITQGTDLFVRTSIKLQEQHNRLWKIIEEARAVYYAKAYEQLYRQILSLTQITPEMLRNLHDAATPLPPHLTRER